MAKMTSINQSELAQIIRDIFHGVVSPKLDDTFNQCYGGRINHIFHKGLIDDIDYSAQKDKRDLIMSMVSLRSNPIIDINVRVTAKTGVCQYYIVGKDLRKYHMYLPKIHDKKMGVSRRPTVGTNHSRWYPHFMVSVMKNISLHLRMLDLYLRTNRIVITREYTIATTGVLGMEVDFDVPDEYTELVETIDIHCEENPIKKCPGIFVFGKNGVNKDITTKMANKISTISSFETVYPSQITKSEELIEFITSKCTYAIGTWNHHARVIIKNFTTNTIDIVDPWKRSIEADILLDFNSSTSPIGWSVNFIKRTIVDQAHGEGSCVLVAFSRLLFLASFGDKIDKTKYDIPIPDFFAFLISFFYRQTR